MAMVGSWRGWSITVINGLTGEIISIPRIRAIFLVGTLPFIPILITIGFAVQSVNVMTEVSKTVIFFSVAAVYAGVAVVVLEDIRPDKRWARAIVLIGCELAIILALYMSLNWVSKKADEAAWEKMVASAHDSKMFGVQMRWMAKTSEQPQPVGRPIAPPPRAARSTKEVIAHAPPLPPKPDISLILVYKTAIAALIHNNSSDVVIRDPKFIPIIWDLDMPDRTDPLPVPTSTFTGEFIRPLENIGPEAIVTHSNVTPLGLKAGDRLFGYIQLLCPDCQSTKYYWIYAVNGVYAWYYELPKGKVPMINALFRSLPAIRNNPEGFFAEIPQSERRPALELP